MKTRMSESIENLAKAQLELQSEIQDINKDATGYGYNYTSFDKLVQYLRPLLTKHGISFIQTPSCNEFDEGTKRIGLTTLYMHTSGEWVENTILSPIAESKGMNLYQSIGSAITYYRRYSLSSFVGIASEEDVDASTSDNKINNNSGDKEPW